MEPLFGPVAGGTDITITGSGPSDYPPSDSRSYIPDLGDAINVYIGRDLSATSLTLSTDVRLEEYVMQSGQTFNYYKPMNSLTEGLGRS